MKPPFTCGLLLLLLPAAAPSGGPRVILREEFRGPALDPAWHADCSPGNTLRPGKEGLEIHARENTFAHVERALRKEGIRVSCAIRPAPAVSWTPSIFLYWDPGDWCQMGVIREGADRGRFYVTETTAGAPVEHNRLGRCDPDAWPRVAVELGADCLRYCSSPDGSTYKTELLSPRSPRFAGPPALVIAGKGYGRGDEAYPAPDLDNDYPEPGRPGVSWIRDLQVETLPSDRLHPSPEEVRALWAALADELGEGILRRGEDPDFGTVAACCPPLKYPREAAGVKEHPFEFVVEPDGSVSLPEAAGGKGEAFFEIGNPPARFGRAPYTCSKRLAAGGLPVITASTRPGEAVMEEAVFGWSEGMRPDKPLWAYLRLAVRNEGKAPLEETVHFRFKVEGKDRAPGPRVRLRVPPGGRSSVCLRLRYDTADPGTETLEERAFQARLAEVTSWWKACLDRGMKVRVPEARVNEARRAWLAWNFLDVDLKKEVYEPHDGAGFYEAVFDYSAALYCHALDLWGFHEEAGRYLDSLISLVEPGGPFFVNYGLPGTGALLFAAAEHYRLTDDRAWLEAAAPRLIGLCDWIAARRRKTIPAAGEEDKEPPLTAGLIRFTPYADYPEETVDYYGDTYCCTGLEAAAAVLRAIGREPEAARMEREAAAYRRDILASMDRAVIRRFGAEILPMEPDTHRLLRSTGYRAGGYYGLIASMMLESGFLPPGGPRARRVTAFLERWGGLTLGMCAFGDGVDHAYTYGYWMDALRRGAVQRVLLGFYGTLACGMSRTTYCGVEVTRLRTGENTPTTPHLYSGTQQLRLLRMMLLREEGETLVIGSGVPRHWLRTGDRIEVEGAPTRFGPCAFSIEVRKDRVLLELTAPDRRPPAAVRIILRRPGNLPIRSVEVNGRPFRTFEADRFTLEKPRGDLRVAIGY